MTEKEFPRDAVSRIDVEAERGVILVRGAEGAVRLRMSDEPAGSCELSARLDGSVLTVSARSAGRWPWSRWRASARIELEAPSGLPVRAAAGQGEVDLRGRSGPVSASVGWGRLHVEGSADAFLRVGRGRAEGRLSGGRLEVLCAAGSVGFQGLAGPAAVRVALGSSRLAWGQAPAGTVDILSGVGGVTLEFPASARPICSPVQLLGAMTSDFSGSEDPPGGQAVELKLMSLAGRVRIRRADAPGS